MNDGTKHTHVKRDELGFLLYQEDKPLVPQVELSTTYDVLAAISVSVPQAASNGDLARKLDAMMNQVDISHDLFKKQRTKGEVRLTQGLYDMLFVLLDKMVPISTEQESRGESKKSVGQHIFGDSYPRVLRQLKGAKIEPVEGETDLWADLSETPTEEEKP
jgi:hypothetical protein